MDRRRAIRSNATQAVLFARLAQHGFTGRLPRSTRPEASKDQGCGSPPLDAHAKLFDQQCSVTNRIVERALAASPETKTARCNSDDICPSNLRCRRRYTSTEKVRISNSRVRLHPRACRTAQGCRTGQPFCAAPLAPQRRALLHLRGDCRPNMVASRAAMVCRDPLERSNGADPRLCRFKHFIPMPVIIGLVHLRCSTCNWRTPCPCPLAVEARFLVGSGRSLLRDPACTGTIVGDPPPRWATWSASKRCLSCDVTASDGLKQGRCLKCHKGKARIDQTLANLNKYLARQWKAQPTNAALPFSQKRRPILPNNEARSWVFEEQAGQEIKRKPHVWLTWIVVAFLQRQLQHAPDRPEQNGKKIHVKAPRTPWPIIRASFCPSRRPTTRQP